MFKKSKQPASAKEGKAAITETAPCQKSLKLQVKPETVSAIRTAVLDEFQKEAVLPGFRKGKAPADLVEKQFAKSIQDETLQRATKQVLEETVKEHSLKPVGPFEIQKADFNEAQGLTLEATVEVEPSFDLADYKGIGVPKPAEAVSAEEMDKALASLQDSMAQLVPGKEGGEKQRQVPPLDDDLAKDLGFKTLQELKEHVEAKLREQKRADSARTREAAVSEELLKRNAFEVPPRLVSHQTEKLTRDFMTRLLLSGTPEDKAKAETDKFTDQLRTSAQRHVKLTFILDRIATQESVSVTQDELVQRLWQLSQRWKKDPAEVRKLLDANGLWPSVVSTIRQEKTMALLLSTSVAQNGGAV